MPRLPGLLVILLIVATGCPSPEREAETERETTEVQTTVPIEGFRDVVEEVLPAIVFIQAEVAPPPELERMFPQLPDELMPMGMGSGVIFREDGYILTNNHVVQDAERVLVVLHDRRYFEAEVVGRDPSTEVAVVRIDGNDLAVATLGDSDAVGLGDVALAMGSPLGLDFSVTAGIVSGTGRAIGIIGAEGAGGQPTPPLEHFIQTDAALSPGNSGGPLVNSAGHVIGINTAVAMQPGVASSFGFAIPSNLAHRVAEQLIEHGEVRRPYLGVALRTVTPTLAEEHGLERVEGASVASVEPGSPADRAGIREGDVIVGIDDQRIITVSALQAELAAREAGTAVNLSLLRNGRERQVDVQLDQLWTEETRVREPR